MLTLARKLHGWREAVKRPFYWVYEQRLIQLAKDWRKPRHIGMILDGNRRFARQAGLEQVLQGHALGAEKVREVLGWCRDFGIPAATMWIFSLDNFKRPQEEVSGLLGLIEEKTRALGVDEDFLRQGVRVRYIGRLDSLPPSLQEAIQGTEAATAHHQRFTLNVAIAYGGREEIMDAVRQCIRRELEAGRDIDDIVESLEPEHIDEYLYMAGQPDPDLIIRTSGEVRLSGFLLWQSAYSEYYFCDSFWPEFRKIDFLRALRSYDHRQRRFGK